MFQIAKKKNRKIERRGIVNVFPSDIPHVFHVNEKFKNPSNDFPKHINFPCLSL